MIQFKTLRLSGFKSFVDRTELDIGPGLNGIVGPNGCGKSNLVEAMRWVMGENSAKRMRGGGMEDVIFNGTDKRSARNFAEVSLLLDNETRQAPAAYNGQNDIEITRRIEKDKGSDYRINGKSARARDVQMLFADTVTGANSPSLVSQGQITKMINSKPKERRLILEESAGIAGLYARRHEAELRLKAADGNLVRVEDVVQSMESRLNTLKRQMRQASRYKNLSAQIRQLELTITYLEWQEILDKKRNAKEQFSAAESLVAEKLTAVTQLTKTQNTQAEELPALRKAEAECAAALQKHKIEFEQLSAQIQRHRDDVQNTKTQLHQTQIDIQHETSTLEESSKSLEALEKEHSALIESEKEDEKSFEVKQSEKENLYKQLLSLEERYTSLKESAAESRARMSSLTQQIQRNEDQKQRLVNRLEDVKQQQSDLVIDEDSAQKITDLKNKTETLKEKRESLSSKTDESRSDIEAAEHKVIENREYATLLEKEYGALKAEIAMLQSFFDAQQQDNHASILEEIVTKAGFEKALSRALGASLMASLDEQAPSFWRNNNSTDLNDLPAGISPLLDHVDAPDILKAALSQIGYVEDIQTGHALSSKLKAGQSLVSEDGYLWRWDGYHVKAEAADQQAIYLQQKNKLIELEAQKLPLESNINNAKKALESAQSTHNNAKNDYNNLLDTIKDIDSKLAELTPAVQKIQERNLKIDAQKKHGNEQIKTLGADIDALSLTIEADQRAIEILHENEHEEHSEDVIDNAKIDLDDIKEDYQNAVRSFDQLTQERRTRAARIQAIADERVAMKNRAIRAREHQKSLKLREEELDTKLQNLLSNPVSKAENDQEALDQISELEAARSRAAEYLAARETEVAETARALKEAEGILGKAREDRAHAQAIYTSLGENLSAMEQRIEENLNIKPQELTTHAAVDLVQYNISDLAKLKSQKETLIRDRNSIGAVNLQAEEEALELEKEFTVLLHERNDLTQAIEELREGINKINKEARERLLVAFDQVNAHFQHLFGRLFRGGKAHLELIDSDDPLGAGLEIFAQPPGKSLQSLSLMSGGEQTLSSIALIFAMFLTNPSPICVLDEIDAPLDDANVDRVCDLLEEIAERGETRFLVVTHHRLTMARMDRLYGVTMSEKGVSQLVSVDMQQSFEFSDQRVA